MPAGLDNLKHIVVLMMENRSFDHMLGGLKAQDPRIDGLTGNETNPDINNVAVRVQPQALYQSQLDPDPDHHFPAVDLQIFNNSNPRVANMQGFVKSYFNQLRDSNHSQKIMYYFKPDKLSILSTLAREFAVLNGWFSSIPGYLQSSFRALWNFFWPGEHGRFRYQATLQEHLRTHGQRHPETLGQDLLLRRRQLDHGNCKSVPAPAGTLRDLRAVHFRLRKRQPSRIQLHRAKLQRPSWR